MRPRSSAGTWARAHSVDERVGAASKPRRDRLGERHRVALAAQVRRQRILRFQRGDDRLAQALGLVAAGRGGRASAPRPAAARTGLAMPLPAMSGAEPCTASKIAASVPMLAPGARPRPPTRPAHRSEMMSPNRLVVTMMSNCSGLHHQLHAAVVDDHLVALDVGILRRDFARDLQEQARGRLQDVGLVHHRDLLAAGAAREVEGVAHDALGTAARDLLRQRWRSRRLRTAIWPSPM